MRSDLLALPASRLGGGLKVSFARNALTCRGLAPKYGRARDRPFSSGKHAGHAVDELGLSCRASRCTKYHIDGSHTSLTTLCPKRKCCPIWVPWAFYFPAFYSKHKKETPCAHFAFQEVTDALTISHRALAPIADA